MRCVAVGMVVSAMVAMMPLPAHAIHVTDTGSPSPAVGRCDFGSVEVVGDVRVRTAATNDADVLFVAGPGRVLSCETVTVGDSYRDCGVFGDMWTVIDTYLDFRVYVPSTCLRDVEE